MTPARQPQEYTFVCECCQNKCKVISYNAIPPDCGCLINSDIGAIWQPRTHTSAPAPAHDCFDCPAPICKYPSLRSEQTQSRFNNQRKMYEARIEDAAKAAREPPYTSSRRKNGLNYASISR